MPGLPIRMAKFMPNPGSDLPTDPPPTRWTLTLPAMVYPPILGADAPISAAIPPKTVVVDAAVVQHLLAAARDQATRAYAPFSRFSVGAALLMADDPHQRLFTGTNVENSSFGGTVCAERTALFTAVNQGLRRLRYLAVTTQNVGAPLHERSPCGLCRQVIREFADDDTLIFIDAAPHGLAHVVDIHRLLPFGFCFAPSPAEDRS